MSVCSTGLDLPHASSNGSLERSPTVRVRPPRSGTIPRSTRGDTRKVLPYPANDPTAIRGWREHAIAALSDKDLSDAALYDVVPYDSWVAANTSPEERKQLSKTELLARYNLEYSLPLEPQATSRSIPAARPRSPRRAHAYCQSDHPLLTVARWKTRPLATHTTTRPDASAKAGGGLAHTHRPMRRLLNTTPCCARAASCIPCLLRCNALLQQQITIAATLLSITPHNTPASRASAFAEQTPALSPTNRHAALSGCSRPQCSAFCSAQR